ncbi:MAG: histidine kinase dimerization/phospho-acceptor domain-containing protein, partial [Bacteroidaceae bacterium]
MNTLIYMTFISGGLIVFILILAFAIYWQIKEKTTVLHKKSKIENFSKIIQDAPFGLYLQKIAFNKEGEQSESMVIWNKEMIKLFGHCAESISPILEGPSKIQFEDAKDSVLKGLSDVTRNIRFNTIHGNNFDGFIQLQLITIENVQFILGVVVNISELKSAINSGIANHREEKTFLTNISNEICIPLNAVIGFTQLLLKETDIKAISHYAELINKKSIDLKYMITDILILAKLESNKLQHEKLTML